MLHIEATKVFQTAQMKWSVKNKTSRFYIQFIDTLLFGFQTLIAFDTKDPETPVFLLKQNPISPFQVTRLHAMGMVCKNSNMLHFTSIIRLRYP